MAALGGLSGSAVFCRGLRPHVQAAKACAVPTIASASFRLFSQSVQHRSEGGRDGAPAGPPYDIMFCGSDEFSVKILDAVWQKKDLWTSIHVLALDSGRASWSAKHDQQQARNNPDARGGAARSPLRAYAEERGLSYAAVGKGDSLKMDAGSVSSQSDTGKNRLILTASFGRLMPSYTLRALIPTSKSLALNVHPSLLPQLRGAAPIQWAIAKRMSETGVTVQQLSEGKFDHGDILAQQTVAVPPGSTYRSLLPVLADVSAALTVDTLANLPARHEQSIPQDPNKATLAFKPTPRDFTVDWSSMTAEDVEASHRAWQHVGGIKTWLKPLLAKEKYLQVFLRDVSLPSAADGEYEHIKRILEPPDVAVGSACLAPKSKRIAVKTTAAASSHTPFVYVSRLQTVSKKPLDAVDWWKGYPSRRDGSKHVTFVSDLDPGAAGAEAGTP